MQYNKRVTKHRKDKQPCLTPTRPTCWLGVIGCPKRAFKKKQNKKRQNLFKEERKSNRRKKGSPPEPRSWPTCWLGVTMTSSCPRKVLRVRAIRNTSQKKKNLAAFASKPIIQ